MRRNLIKYHDHDTSQNINKEYIKCDPEFLVLLSSPWFLLQLVPWPGSNLTGSRSRERRETKICLPYCIGTDRNSNFAGEGDCELG